jgi:hypothetical protein
MRVKRTLTALLLPGSLAAAAALPAGAHTPGIRYRWRTPRYEQVATTKTRVLFFIKASSFRSSFATMRCKVKPTVRVEDPTTGQNTWYTATWNVRWRVRPERTSSHGWWLGVEHPEGTANSWAMEKVGCHA